MQWRRRPGLIAVVLALTACNGGTGSSESGPSVPSSTDVVTTSPVTGTTPAANDATTSSLTQTDPTTTVDDQPSGPTYIEGAAGPVVLDLQRMLNEVIGAGLSLDGSYGADTAEAVAAFQRSVGLPDDGRATAVTRARLAELAAELMPSPPATWAAPSFGGGSTCRVTIIGDSLMGGDASLHEEAVRAIGCDAVADGYGGRAMTGGWLCVEQDPDGASGLVLLPSPRAGDDTCGPAGLQLLDLWSGAGALGDLVVMALGTNDAGIEDEGGWVERWDRVLAKTGTRPVVFLTTRGAPGSGQESAQNRYSAALRDWCDDQPRCWLADWALTDTALDPNSYVDWVHLRREAVQARADFIASAVAELVAAGSTPPGTTAPQG